MAVDAASGTPLWSFQTNQVWRASPMTYMFDGRQYIAVASGNNIIAFRECRRPEPVRCYRVVRFVG